MRTGELPLTVTIYHNPACGTSRNTLAMIRQSGEEPHVIEYLKTPPVDSSAKRNMLMRSGFGRPCQVPGGGTGKG